MTPATSGEPVPGRDFWHAQAGWLGERFIDREQHTRALQLAVLTREHAFLLGPPGTGKSSFVRGFLAGFEGRYFEHSLSRTRVDAAVLGPISIPLLRDTGQLRRETRGYLLDCDWAFLDEIAHISPELGHDLLAALNERISHEVVDGRASRAIPLRTAVTAANCLPQLNSGADGDDSRALWDRLLVRAPVDYLTRREDARRLLQVDEMAEVPGTVGAAGAVGAPGTHGAAGTDGDGPRLSLAALDRHCLAARGLPLAPGLVDTCLDLREQLRATGDVFSDRRWRASMRVLQAAAWLRGADRADVEDLPSLAFTLWDSLAQRDRVRRHLVVITDPDEAERLELIDIAALLRHTSLDYDRRSGPVREAWRREAERKLRHLRDRANRLARSWSSRDQRELDDLHAALSATARALASLRDGAHLAG